MKFVCIVLVTLLFACKAAPKTRKSLEGEASEYAQKMGGNARGVECVTIEARSEQLDIERDQVVAENESLRSQLAALRAARDELADIAEAATFVLDNGICEKCKRSIENVEVERIDELRKAGGEK